MTNMMDFDVFFFGPIGNPKTQSAGRQHVSVTVPHVAVLNFSETWENDGPIGISGFGRSDGWSPPEKLGESTAKSRGRRQIYTRGEHDFPSSRGD